MAATTIVCTALAKALGVSPWVFKAPVIAGKAAATGGVSLLFDLPAEISAAIANVGAQKIFEAVTENPELLADLKGISENAMSNFSGAGGDKVQQAAAREALRGDLRELIRDNT